MNRRTALGLMSGTSADGVSLALVAERSGRPWVLAHATYPYPAALRERILAAPRSGARELCRLNFELGRVFAAAASRFLKRKAGPRVAGSHGQTIVHLPEESLPSTLQIGEPSFLAEALGIPVVSDFRPRDMAAGGGGAPLIPFFDEVLFGAGEPTILQNIGGIANASLVGRGVRASGFDTGPGNCLIDLAARVATGGRRTFDSGGAIARRGRPDEVRVRRLLRAPFFLRRPPKSFDRSTFGEDYLRRFLMGPGVRPEDAVATATLLAASSIVDAWRRFLLPRARVRRAVVSGGGALNPVLMATLRRLSPVPVLSSADCGIPPLAKEPAAMAWMALLALDGKVNHCPRATGARGPRILGKITPC